MEEQRGTFERTLQQLLDKYEEGGPEEEMVSSDVPISIPRPAPPPPNDSGTSIRRREDNDEVDDAVILEVPENPVNELVHSPPEEDLNAIREGSKQSCFKPLAHWMQERPQIGKINDNYRTGSKDIDEMIKNGVPWQGKKMERKLLFNRTKQTKEETLFMDWMIGIWLDEGVVVQTKKEDVIASMPIRVVRHNITGKPRIVHDERYVNKFIPPGLKKVNYDDVSTIKEMTRKDRFAILLDLSKAYLTVEMSKDWKGKLCFPWKGKFYDFRRLPFGLGIAPRVFQTMMKAIVKDDKTAVYLDDITVLGYSRRDCKRRAFRVMRRLVRAGFIINKDKCILEPTQEFTVLGVQFNTKEGWFRISRKRAIKARKIIDAISKSRRCSKRVKMLITGIMASCLVIDRTFFCLVSFLRRKIKKKHVKYLKRLKAGITDRKRPLWCVAKTQVHSDASDSVVVAIADRKLRIMDNGESHINEAETRGVAEAIKLLKPRNKFTKVIAFCDNQAAVGAINKGRSGNFRMNYWIRQIGILSRKKNLEVKAVWIATDFTPADAFTRLEVDKEFVQFPIELPYKYYNIVGRLVCPNVSETPKIIRSSFRKFKHATESFRSGIYSAIQRK